MQIRFIHAADFHLDRPFAGLRGADESIGERLRDATLESLNRVVDICTAEQVDFAVFAGDIFDGDEPTLRAQVAFVRSLKRLADAGIPAYVVHGNHDPWSDWSSSLAWPDLCHRFSPEEVECVGVKRGREAICQVYGTSFAKSIVMENLALTYRRNDHAPFAVAVLHGDVGGSEDSPYAPCALSDLRADFDYWALGHIHDPQILRPADPCVIYAGCTQGLDPTQTGPRGCWLVTLEDDTPPAVELRPTCSAEWQRLPVSISELEGEGELLEALVTLLEAAAAAASGELLLARVELTGSGALHGVARDAGQTGGLLETLRDEAESLSRPVWIESIRDGTRPAVDLDVRAEGDDFVGEFLRLADEVAGDEAALGELRQQLSPLIDHRDLTRALSVSDDDVRRWVQQARVSGAEHLIQEHEA